MIDYLDLAIAPLSVLASTPFKDLAALKILCVGGHPDDPESGCGGTLAKLSAAGHDVTTLYLTRGEAGIPGKSHAEASAIRSKEAEAACKLLSVRPHFLGQIDGNTIVNNEWIDKMVSFLEQSKPDIVFTRTGQLIHTKIIKPSAYSPRKHGWAAKKNLTFIILRCSRVYRPLDFILPIMLILLQRGKLNGKLSIAMQVRIRAEIFSHGHELMEQFRGLEAGYKAAEAFVYVGGKTRVI